MFLKKNHPIKNSDDYATMLRSLDADNHSSQKKNHPTKNSDDYATMLRSLDADGDSKIDFHEFADYINNILEYLETAQEEDEEIY